MNQISGLMLTAVAGGGVVTPVIGFAIDNAGITAGVIVILLCVLYLTYCGGNGGEAQSAFLYPRKQVCIVV